MASTKPSELSPRDRQRVAEILGLREDLWSRNTLERLADIQSGNALSKRVSTQKARAQLTRLRAAMHSALRMLRQMDDRGLEAWLLRGANGDAFDVPGERERYETLLTRIDAALEAAPRPGHRARRNTAELIRALGSLYRLHRRKVPASTPGGDFEELVRIVLKLQSPGKEIRAALK